ncbi:MAG: hypothetical protein IJL02_10070 [Methanobrevibacter sp.]|uniref:hypothetical protein n=1 Tax=Methanobrevibacter sp. TaxID=66852 RepID=UPI0025FB56FF|nr:hypothetical protein [Methanobrevibacter sp.]MBQ6100188.1 hypothetical protein [Methanobrevibacter sp.]
MSEEKITYSDVQQYEKLFSLTPSFLLERFAKKNTNLVLKFESKAKSFLSNLSDHQKKKLDIVLNSEIEDLQAVMQDAYSRTNKKQYKILANPKYKEFIELNIEEVRKMIN